MNERLKDLNEISKNLEFINNMSFEQFKETLININSILRNEPVDECGIYEGFMQASDLISPSNENQLKLLMDYYVALKDINDNKIKAALSYYIINDLHLFGDGNGRTSRYLYLLFSGELDIEKQIGLITHDESNMKSGQENFNIADIDVVNWWSGYILAQILKRENKIDDDKRLNLYSRVATYAKGAIGAQSAHIPENIKQQFSKLELADLNAKLCDNNGNYTTAGISMCILLTEQDKFSEALENNQKRINTLISEKPDSNLNNIVKSGLVFRVGDETSLTSAWDIETFRRFRIISEDIKYRQLKTLIEFFQKPNNFMINENENVLKEILPSYGKTFKNNSE